MPYRLNAYGSQEEPTLFITGVLELAYEWGGGGKNKSEGEQRTGILMKTFILKQFG